MQIWIFFSGIIILFLVISSAGTSYSESKGTDRGHEGWPDEYEEYLRPDPKTH